MAVASLALMVGARVVDTGANDSPASSVGDQLAARALEGHAAVSATPVASAGIRVLGWNPPHATPQLPPGLPLVGVDVASQTTTCARSRTPTTPRVSADCTGWVASGPVNVVIVSTDTAIQPQPTAALIGGAWRPALGTWLVARGTTTTGPAGCQPGDHPSGGQAEHRLDASGRHHVKFIALSCAGDRVLVGDVHTDRWAKTCHGDVAVDWDQARDDLVTALEATGRVHEVAYLPAPAGARSYPGGCGREVTTDGLVAYVVMGSG